MVEKPSTAIDDDEGESPIVVGPREQLFHLLAEAAEIEHTLMCSYLYAAFSLKDGTSDGLGGAEAAKVARWREAILSVAIDEMSHLLLVANLSIAIGGRPHFGRPNFPVSPGYFPSGVVVKLAPFDMNTLTHFIYLERPRGVDCVDGRGFEHERDYRREEAYLGLMPSVQDYETVGRLYEALRANLIASAARLGEHRLFIGSPLGQVGPEAVKMPGVHVIRGLQSALSAIDNIVEQGEGSPGDRENSHYHRFRTIQREYEELLAANPAFEPAWPVATNPVMRKPPEPDDKIFVEHRLAARVLDLANAIYNLLLRYIVQAFGRQDADASLHQRRYLETAIALMHTFGNSARMLARLPASPQHAGVNAGVTFTILRGVEPFLHGESEEALLRERMQEICEGARQLSRLDVKFAPLGESLAATLRQLY